MTGYSQTAGGITEYRVTDGSVPAATAAYLINSNQGPQLAALVLAGNDTFFGSAFADHLIGYGGNDLLYASSGADILDGGGGTDTVIYAGNRSSYTISMGTDGAWHVQKPSAAGSDTLSNNIERLQFADTNIALDTGGSAGMAYRLYQATFERAPLKNGLGYWINVLDHGASLYDVAGYFMQSAEFTAMYGAHPTNTGMVTEFYQHVLHRAPKEAGLNYWVNLLDTHAATPAGVLSEFSESAENQAQVIGVIQNGMEYTPFA